MATVRLAFIGTLQYASPQEALGAAQWLDTWMQINYSYIRPAGSAYRVDALIPAVTDDTSQPAANAQLSWTIHLEGDDAVLTPLWQSVGAAIGDGGVLQAIQNSGTGGTAE